MFLKRMDEVLQSGMYDCQDNSTEAEVFLAEPQWGEKLVHWEIVGKGFVPKSALHYDDTSDGSLTFFGSYQKFFISGKSLADGLLYSGSSFLFKDGLPAFGGVAKAAFYLRYSPGVIDWIESFDAKQASVLRGELDRFHQMLVGPTCKFPAKWQDFSNAGRSDLWALPIITRLSSGKFLVPFLNSGAPKEACEELADIDVDVNHSLELMSFFTAPPTEGREMISDLFQMGSGLGRNPFGKDAKGDLPDSEYQRLFGGIPVSSRNELLDILSKKLEYRIKFFPNPDGSSLLFLPEGNLPYSELKRVIDGENERRSLYWEEAKKKKTKKNDEVEASPVKAPIPIPAAGRSTIFMVNIEGSQKKKLIVQQIFPSIELNYFVRLNEEFLHSKLQYVSVGYMKQALTGQDRDTPSVYQYWTDLFSAALQKQFISGQEVYSRFQEFARTQPGEKLIDDGSARIYFSFISKLLRLQHLIWTAREDPKRLSDEALLIELNEIEAFERIPKQGVFGTMNNTSLNAAELIGEEHYKLLREKETAKLEAFIKRAAIAVPSDEFAIFTRGALTGMLLQNLCWVLNQEGRRFSVTQGRQPTRLRGVGLSKIFTKGVGLLLNLGKEQAFNCQMLSFVKSVEEESRRDSFNNGLILGLTFFDTKKSAKQSEDGE